MLTPVEYVINPSSMLNNTEKILLLSFEQHTNKSYEEK